MRSHGWQDMSPADRFDEADKRMRRLTDRKAALRRRHAPRDWLDQYDEALVHAVYERARWEGEMRDREDAQRRRTYEVLDYGA